MKKRFESFKISTNLLIWLTPLQITTKKGAEIILR